MIPAQYLAHLEWYGTSWFNKPFIFFRLELWLTDSAVGHVEVKSTEFWIRVYFSFLSKNGCAMPLLVYCALISNAISISPVPYILMLKQMSCQCFARWPIFIHIKVIWSAASIVQVCLSNNRHWLKLERHFSLLLQDPRQTSPFIPAYIIDVNSRNQQYAWSLSANRQLYTYGHAEGSCREEEVKNPTLLTCGCSHLCCTKPNLYTVKTCCKLLSIPTTAFGNCVVTLQCHHPSSD